MRYSVQNISRHIEDLSSENASEWQARFQSREEEATNLLLNLEQKLSVAQAAHSQFNQALELVQQISGPVNRTEAWQVGREALREAQQQRHLADQLPSLRLRLSELEQRLREQHDAERLLAEFCKRQGQQYEADALEDLHREYEARIEQLSSGVDEASEQRLLHRQSLD